MTHPEPHVADTLEIDGPFWTVARIAEHVGVPRHRVEYIIETRGIRPAAWVGHARVFEPVDVDRVRVELDRIERGAL